MEESSKAASKFVTKTKIRRKENSTLKCTNNLTQQHCSQPAATYSYRFSLRS